MDTKVTQEQLFKTMEHWQKSENETISLTGQVIFKTDNPIIRLVMEIIQRDSQAHFRVQQLIKESLQSKTVTLSPEELGKIWDLLERHIKIERFLVENARDLLAKVKVSTMPVQTYLLDYLFQDEQKHDRLLEGLEKFKRGMYP